jgi:nicotinate-nucleotide pyrophosphorylase (carboxylating)
VHDAHPPIGAAREAVARALAEDLTPIGDLTSLLLPPDLVATARFVPRSDGVMAGRLCVDEAFRQVDAALTVEWSADDGDALTAGKEVAHVTGPLAPILTAERTALNFLGRLSGVATLTATVVRAIEAAGGGARLLDTRKTTPGLRALEKRAVADGGGANHRAGLYDFILIKENHAALAGGVGEAVRRARAARPELPLAVEVRDAREIDEALAAGAPRLLLDNMTPAQVARAVAQVGGRAELEASGGVTPDTVVVYSTIKGLDYVSIGALTHSAPILDLSLLLEIATP